jgi:poly-gamma-glutamate capsule biosynthesis protein CapA/YwtB (metallophosphatase superfamily)
VRPTWQPIVLILGGLLLVIRPLLPADSRAVTIAFLGDVMLGRGIAAAHADGDWQTTLAVIAPHISQADLSIANLESPLTEKPMVKLGYDLRAPFQASQSLNAAGLDILTLANNHARDSGEAGVQDTRRALSASGFTAIGPEPDVYLTAIRNNRIALIALDDVSAPIKLDTSQQMIRSAHAIADFVIITVHWGSEYAPAPSSREIELVSVWAQAGADVIVGHHSHVLQPIEWLTQSDSRKTLIAYSLGNAIFDQFTPPAARLGAVLFITMTRHSIVSYQILPFQIDPHRGELIAADEKTTQVIQRQLGIRLKEP